MSQNLDSVVKIDFNKNLSSNTVKPLIIIDAGHGGLDLKGHYVNHPHKRQEHMRTQINEGVLNRALAHLLSFRLDMYNIPNCVISDSETGTELSLKHRCSVANFAAAEYHKNTDGKALFISIHHNWFEDEKVNGFEVFTIYKQNQANIPISSAADYIAQYAGKEYSRRFTKSKVRRPKASSPLMFKKENFQVLRDTRMPSLLFEFGFMSNKGDYYRMSSLEGISAHVDYLEEMIAKVVTCNFLDFQPSMIDHL